MPGIQEDLPFNIFSVGGLRICDGADAEPGAGRAGLLVGGYEKILICSCSCMVKILRSAIFILAMRRSETGGGA